MTAYVQVVQVWVVVLQALHVLPVPSSLGQVALSFLEVAWVLVGHMVNPWVGHKVILWVGLSSQEAPTVPLDLLVVCDLEVPLVI